MPYVTSSFDKAVADSSATNRQYLLYEYFGRGTGWVPRSTDPLTPSMLFNLLPELSHYTEVSVWEKAWRAEGTVFFSGDSVTLAWVVLRVPMPGGPPSIYGMWVAAPNAPDFEMRA